MGMAPLDCGPVLLRKPFGSRLAADTLPSGCPCGQSPTVGASPWLSPSFPTSCPHRVRHGRMALMGTYPSSLPGDVQDRPPPPPIEGISPPSIDKEGLPCPILSPAAASHNSAPCSAR